MLTTSFILNSNLHVLYPSHHWLIFVLYPSFVLLILTLQVLHPSFWLYTRPKTNIADFSHYNAVPNCTNFNQPKWERYVELLRVRRNVLSFCKPVGWPVLWYGGEDKICLPRVQLCLHLTESWMAGGKRRIGDLLLLRLCIWLRAVAGRRN